MAVAVEPPAAKWEVPQIWLFFLVVVFKFFGLKFLLVFVLNLVHVFFFYRVYLLDFPWRSRNLDSKCSTSHSRELRFWVHPIGTACQILGLHSVPFSYILSFPWTQSTFLIFLVNRAQDRKWLCHGWIVMSFFALVLWCASIVSWAGRSCWRPGARPQQHAWSLLRLV